MKIGVVFPQIEIGSDPLAIRDYAQAAEELGYRHILAYDHVLGADISVRPDWSGPYTSDTPFHEIFVLFGYLAALTRTVELVTGVLILPQRQTALVAKQTAAVDVLSGGRLRLGVGVGWNKVEYEGLNEDFHTRGARVAEQVEILRALWTQPVVTFDSAHHHLPAAGINPLPVQRPIPVWFGGHAEATLKRAGQMADGWFPLGLPTDERRDMIARLHGYAREAGRSPQDIGIEATLSVSLGSDADLAAWARGWQALGATHACVNTMRAGFDTPQKHIDAIRHAKTVLADAGFA